MKTAVVGISGGIDSAVVAALCVRALGKENALGIRIPIESSEQSLIDGEAVINYLETPYLDVCFDHIMHDVKSYFPPEYNTTLAVGNIKARLRMIVLYHIAFSHQGLVVGTTNYTEQMLGYATKFGDHGVDIEPIQNYYKMEIFEMARLLGIPEQIINKKPTADLWDGQTDEDELGLTYARIDEILKSPELNTSDDSDFVKVRKMIKASEHKRNVAPSYKKLRRENENSIGGRCSERFYAWWQSCYRGWR